MRSLLKSIRAFFAPGTGAGTSVQTAAPTPIASEADVTLVVPGMY